MNEKLNAGGVEGKDLSQGRIDLLADGFGVVNHLLKHEFNVAGKAQLKASKQRRVRDFCKAAEIAKLFLQRIKRIMSRESVGMEKIFCRIRAERKAVRG